MDKKLRLLGISLALLAFGFLSFGIFSLIIPVIRQKQGVVFYLRPGMSKKTFIAELDRQGIARYPIFLLIYTYTQKDALLKKGEYLFLPGSNLVSIWRQVTTGAGQVYHPFTIVPGWSFVQLRQEMNQTQSLRHLTADMTDEQIMLRLGFPQLAPEGEFFPETYYYTRGDVDLVILKRALDLMQKRLRDAWDTRANDLPFKNQYEALIAASMVEKEAYFSTERPLIAAVIVNRLKKDMLLQIDPTVIYGLGTRYTGKLHKSDLSDNTLYNTYLHKGLPPTPIAMPSIGSIESTLHPSNEGYLYFVAKGDGGHTFSYTLAEHNNAVEAASRRMQSSDASSIKHYLLSQIHALNYTPINDTLIIR